MKNLQKQKQILNKVFTVFVVHSKYFVITMRKKVHPLYKYLLLTPQVTWVDQSSAFLRLQNLILHDPLQKQKPLKMTPSMPTTRPQTKTKFPPPLRRQASKERHKNL